MSIIGSSCLVLAGGQFREAIIRASSQPLYDSPNLNQARVSVQLHVLNAQFVLVYKCFIVK